MTHMKSTTGFPTIYR